jgi:hypothetical protein
MCLSVSAFVNFLKATVAMLIPFCPVNSDLSKVRADFICPPPASYGNSYPKLFAMTVFVIPHVRKSLMSFNSLILILRFPDFLGP